MKVYALQHAEPETPGQIAEVLRDRDIGITTVRSFAGEDVPATMAGHDGLVVMGGPMGVYEVDRYPYLGKEIDLIRDAVRAGKSVLGVCLGSQLVAAALGAKVAPAQKEIGWHPISLTDAAARDPIWKGVERSFDVLHWHGDAFDLPQGATHLSESTVTRYQAFRYGKNVYGFLFHMEMDEGMVRAMVESFGDELRSVGGDAAMVLARTDAAVREMRRIGRMVFGRWADTIGRRDSAR